MDVPPDTAILAFGFGDEFRDDLKSDINGPAADGGGLEGCERTGGFGFPEFDEAVGFWTVSGFSCRAKALDLLGFWALEPPAT